MPIACLRIPWFALRIAVLDRPQLDGHPLVLGNPQGGRPVVVDATPEARELGIRPGMTLRETRAICPVVVVLTPDPVRETTVAGEIGRNLDAISPLVEPDEPGCWYIDLAGLERHYASLEAAVQRILGCAHPVLQPRAGVARDRFTARVAATVARPGRIRSVADGESRDFLARAPVSVLPLPPADILLLERLGLRTLAQFTGVPARKIAARFGSAGRRAWELAAGQDATPVTPPRKDSQVVRHLVMAAPTASREMLLVGLKQLVAQAFALPELRDRGVRRVTLQAVLEGDRRSWERSLVLKEPSGQERVTKALELRLQDLELDGAVEAVTVTLSGISAVVARQAALGGMGPRATAPLRAALDHLTHRYGYTPLYHVVEVEPWSRIPERRYALAPTSFGHSTSLSR
jgi:DNA polymerase-4/protein ImuB